jgi:hypothetical protein
MLTSAVKSPNFYYALKLLCTLYLGQLAEWNSNSTTLQAIFFGANVSTAIPGQIPANPAFTNATLTNSFLVTA